MLHACTRCCVARTPPVPGCGSKLGIFVVCSWIQCMLRQSKKMQQAAMQEGACSTLGMWPNIVTRLWGPRGFGTRPQFCEVATPRVMQSPWDQGVARKGTPCRTVA